jgi:type IV secretory pathway VirB4 component
MATIEYRGPDLDSSVEEILAILTSQLNSLFMTLDTGFIFYFEMQRTPSLDYPTKNYFPDEVTKKIDLERRLQLEDSPEAAEEKSGNYWQRDFLFLFMERQNFKRLQKVRMIMKRCRHFMRKSR